jgi:hypothetical protein
MFALVYDVGYCAEPMVCYREHALSMTEAVTRQDHIENCAAADLAVLWMVRQRAEAFGLSKVSRHCLVAIAGEYARHGRGKQYRSARSFMSSGQFEESVGRSTESKEERNWIRARFLEALGDRCFLRGDGAAAKGFYLRGLQKDVLMPKVYLKVLLLLLGRPGEYVRRLARSVRMRAAGRRDDVVGPVTETQCS